MNRLNDWFFADVSYKSFRVTYLAKIEILNFNIINSGHLINKGYFLFEKIEDEEIFKQYEKLKKNKK